MRVGIFSFIMTASLLTGGSLGAQVAQASMGQLKPADVVLIDSRGCERPEASPFDPFNKNLLRPCAAWVTYSQVELKDLGLFTVSKTRTQGGLKPRAAQVSGSTPENYAIAKNISVLRSLLQNFKNSREQTEIFVSTLEQLNHWIRPRSSSGIS